VSRVPFLVGLFFLVTPIAFGQQPQPIRQDVTPLFNGPVVFEMTQGPNPTFVLSSSYKKNSQRFITHDWVGNPEISANFMTVAPVANPGNTKAKCTIKRIKDQNGVVVTENATNLGASTANANMQTPQLGGKRIMCVFNPPDAGTYEITFSIEVGKYKTEIHYNGAGGSIRILDYWTVTQSKKITVTVDP
jgi:hypothetical protein